jgi:hypothetical protein
MRRIGNRCRRHVAVAIEREAAEDALVHLASAQVREHRGARPVRAPESRQHELGGLGRLQHPDELRVRAQVTREPAVGGGQGVRRTRHVQVGDVETRADQPARFKTSGTFSKKKPAMIGTRAPTDRAAPTGRDETLPPSAIG